MKIIMTVKQKLRSTLRRAVLFLLLYGMIVVGAGAQDFTSSPYSRFGIGDLLSRCYGQGEAMGGLGIGLNSRGSLNLMNPAGIGQMDSLQFIFEVGATNRLTRFSTTDLNKTTNNLGFSYLGLGFPIAHWWKGSVGVMPYSGVGYSMSEIKIDPIIGEVGSKFSGDGGISQFFIQQSFSPGKAGKFKYVSLGFTFSYLFGPVNHSKTLLFPEDSSYFSTKSTSTSIVGDIHLSYGAQFHVPLKNDYFLTLGGIFENQSDIKTESQQLVYSVGQGIIDTLYYNEDPNNSIVLPMGYGAGFSFGKKNKFTVGADYRVQNWENALFLGHQDSLANSHKFVLGMEYIPDAYSPTSYYKRMKYRAGFRYGKSYIQLRETQLNEFGINFGVGLPTRTVMGGRASLMNISAEIGKRGTIENNLISEFYGLLSIQITLRDVWFLKHKYD